MKARTSFVIALVLWAADAKATSTKQTPVPGITHIHRWDERVQGALQDYHVLLVELADPGLRFRVSTQDDRNHPVSYFGPKYNAHLAVNASFFNFSDREPCGPTQSDGTFWTNASSGCTTSAAFGEGAMAIFDNGAQATGPWPTSVSFATDGVSGQPWLIRDGQPTGPWTSPGSINTRNARTAIGITATARTMILLVVDSGRANAAGMTGNDLILVFNEFAAHQALNLDGTGSTALWIASEGGLINKPSEGAERSVSNALMIVPNELATDAGVDATTDAPASDSTPTDSAIGPEDPTGDGGEVIDVSTYNPGNPALPGSPAGDNTGCACEVAGERSRAPSFVLALAIALGLTRRAGRRRA
jgi:exopolysaccharide biosynthesis protein